MEISMINSPESKVDSFVEELLYETELNAAFHGFTVYTNEDRKKRYEKEQKSIKALFASLSKDEIGPAVIHYVKRISSTVHHEKTRLLVALLEHAVTNNCVSPRLVCETLLRNEDLVYENEYFWCLSFMLINAIIPGVDYKGVRDLLKTVLVKAHGMKSANNVCVMNQFRAIEKLLETIMDRNACLLPSYLILDDLQKKLSKETNGASYPHWKFSKLISSFIDSFRPVAKMVSISVFMELKGDDATVASSKLLPVVGHSTTLGNAWKLDAVTVRAPLKGMLPYNKELLEPQTALLRYVLEQSYSREMVCGMLGVSKQQKQRCPALEEQLVELLIEAMDKSETDLESMEEGGSTQLLWQHFSTQVIYFVFCQYASFSHLIEIMCKRVKSENIRKGREHLMWVFLQFISGSIKKNPLGDFLPIIKLYDLLYPEKEPLPIPDLTKPSVTHAFASTCIWIHLMRKAHMDNLTLARMLPIALTSQFEFLQNCLKDTDLSHTLYSDYRISLLCNAYSTNTDCFTRPMGVLVEAVYGTAKQQATSTPPTKPLSMALLDSLAGHTKMSLVHHIVTHILTLAQSKAPADANVQPKQASSSHILTPALVETYSRLLAYNEIEPLGIKSFITQLLPVVFRSQAWGILHTLLEMFSYRLHHFQSNFRVQLLNHLHSLACVVVTNQIQLHICVESTALKLISGMGNAEVQPQLSRLPTEPKSLFSNDSEELNKVLVLTIARAIHVTGSESLSATWCKEILSTIVSHTPHTWASYTLQCFPKVLANFFENPSHQVPTENKAGLKRSVEEEFRKWKTMSNENDIIQHFSASSGSSLFLCLLWKMLLDQDRISTIAYEILDRIGARALSAHLRTFADFLVFECSISNVGQHVNKYIEALNHLIWRCHVLQLDRLILCLVLRSFEGNEAQVCFFIIHMLLSKSQDFMNRVNEFLKNNSPEHWKRSDQHEKHLMFHRMFEEKFYFEGLRDLNKKSSQHTNLPTYFGNVCLRFLPVMDIVIHRFIEMPPVNNILETFIDTYGCLYKFHSCPLSYLYNTLHYYEKKLRELPLLKKKLVSTIVGSLKDIRPEGWALSEGYLAYLEDTSEELTWVPDQEYYVKLIGRFVDSLAGKNPFPHTDWRFNEFTNEGAHALHVTCIELMALPIATQSVGKALLDIILKGRTVTVSSNIVAWMNAVGLVITALPDVFWSVLNDRILETMQSPLMTNPFPDIDAFTMFDFTNTYNGMTEIPFSYLIALTHSVYYHATPGQICSVSQLLKDRFKPVVKTEEQFLFVCHLVCPFLQRTILLENAKYALEITVDLYEMLESVDKNCDKLQYMDTVCDLLYHIKYMFIGDAIETEIEKSIRNLRPAFRRKLRFISHQKIEEIILDYKE